MLVVSLPNLLILSYWFIIPESPRWLLANNKIEEFRRVIDSAAAVNKRQIDVEVLTTIFQSKDELKSKEGQKNILFFACLFFLLYSIS